MSSPKVWDGVQGRWVHEDQLVPVQVPNDYETWANLPAGQKVAIVPREGIKALETILNVAEAAGVSALAARVELGELLKTLAAAKRERDTARIFKDEFEKSRLALAEENAGLKQTIAKMKDDAIQDGMERDLKS